MLTNHHNRKTIRGWTIQHTGSEHFIPHFIPKTPWPRRKKGRKSKQKRWENCQDAKKLILVSFTVLGLSHVLLRRWILRDLTQIACECDQMMIQPLTCSPPSLWASLSHWVWYSGCSEVYTSSECSPDHWLVSAINKTKTGCETTDLLFLLIKVKRQH